LENNGTCEIVIVGSAHTDLQLYPVGRDVLEKPSYSVKQMLLTVGGDAINEATVLTHLGHKVKLVTCIGKDSIGDFVIEHCTKNKIDTSCIKRDPEKTTSINVGLVAEDGERTFINNRSGSIWTFAPKDVNLDAVSEGKILSFASIFNNPLLDESIMIPLFKKAKDRGMIICADIVASKNGETIDSIRNALPYIDYFFPNYTEAKEIAKKDSLDEIADVILGCGVKNVIIKTGKEGCFIKNIGTTLRIPAYPKAKCIDTTGAGDNFASGFISGLLEGRDLKACAEFANCTASVSVEKIGATAGVTDRETVEERFREYKKILNR